jgi:ornithine cyclodeaminase
MSSSSSPSSSAAAPPLLLISESLVRSSLTLAQAIHINAQAFIAAWEQTAKVPQYMAIVEPSPEDASVTNASLFKGAQVSAALGVKVVCVRPTNQGRDLPTIPAVILLNDRTTGLPTALIQATYLTALRTAAGSAAATDLAAKADSTVLTVLGSGLQAREHIRAMLEVRPGLKNVHVLNRTRERAEALVTELRPLYPSVTFSVHSLDLEKDAGAAEAVRKADIICTVTNNGLLPSSPSVSRSHHALLHSKHVSEGTHINAIGSYLPGMHELSSELVAKSRLVIDCSSALHSGDVHTAITEKLLNPEELLELGAVLERRRYEGEVEGVGAELETSKRKRDAAVAEEQRPVWRRSAEEITIFKSVGSAVQDIATAYAVLQRCQQQGLGKTAEW